ncbi:hypothetical protein [Aneurinibacillus aneurinilyticus]|uniref:hypothetical protein n=1 Tax=Aneurinibacillus aneurinilyticus TaxID=1391 RepID=UPI0023F079B0|nr:hypothetical protein [Aneurinibacillus aneurinilyticus]
MNSLLTESEVKILFPNLAGMDNLGAALLQASIFVLSSCSEPIPEPTPDDIKLAVCLLLQVMQPVTQVKSVERSDFKQTFDTKDTRWPMIERILKKYGYDTGEPEDGVVRFY